MDKSRRLVILSLTLVALVFTGAYALAGDGGGDDPRAAPTESPDAPSPIETPSIDVPAAPPGGELPELQVPEPTATPGDAGPGLESTPTPEPSTPDTPDPAPTPQPTPAPTEPPITRGGGED